MIFHRSLFVMLLVKLLSPVDLFWDPMDCSIPRSSDNGISQARIPEWVAISLSRGSTRLRDGTWDSCTLGRFFTTEPPGKTLVYYAKALKNTLGIFFHASSLKPCQYLIFQIKYFIYQLNWRIFYLITIFTSNPVVLPN